VLCVESGGDPAGSSRTHSLAAPLREPRGPTIIPERNHRGARGTGDKTAAEAAHRAVGVLPKPAPSSRLAAGGRALGGEMLGPKGQRIVDHLRVRQLRRMKHRPAPNNVLRVRARARVGSRVGVAVESGGAMGHSDVLVLHRTGPELLEWELSRFARRRLFTLLVISHLGRPGRFGLRFTHDP